MPNVSILRTAAYEPQLLDATVARHFALLGLEQLVKPDLRITLKVNLLMKAVPNAAVTTHPELVAAVVRWLRAHGVSAITLADSPGGPYTKAVLDSIYAASGMAEMAAREGILLNHDLTWQERPTQGTRITSVAVIAPVTNADLVINICKLKTHCMTGLSGAVKNMFGCIPGLQKAELHYRFQNPADFCEMLCDLYETVCPAIVLVDAVDAMEGDGPSGGTPIHAGLTLCSTNGYALDLVLCRIIGMAPERAGTVNASIKRGLAPELTAIELLGEPEAVAEAKPFRQPRTKAINFNYHLPQWLQSMADAVTNRFFVPRPVVQASVCVGCSKCAESCPAKTIDMVERKAVIRIGNCIKCYCCQELCPTKAIKISRNRLFRL